MVDSRGDRPSGDNRADRAVPWWAGVKHFKEDKGLLQIIDAAGWPIWPLILASIIGLALIIERFSTLRTSRVVPPKLLDEVITVTSTHLPSHDVVSKLESNSLMGQVLAGGIRAMLADPRITEYRLREAFDASGRIAVQSMDRYLTTLGTIAAMAPLMGLLGTVIGMIEIFAAQGVGGANPTQLAYGISIALYNTAFGLIVAIPALIFYRYLRGRVDDYAVQLEVAVERVLPHLMRLMPAPAATPPAPAAPAPKATSRRTASAGAAGAAR